MSRLIPDEENVVEEPVKKRSKKTASKKKSLVSSLMSGELLTRDNLINNLPFLFYVAFILICYIGYGYYVDKTSRSIAELEKQTRELKAEKNNEDAFYNQMSMFSRIADSTVSVGLVPAANPPKKIKVSPMEFNAE